MRAAKQKVKRKVPKARKPEEQDSDREPRVESRALAKGLLLLETLASHRRPMRLPEMAEVLKLGKPSTLRLLQTLVATGFAARADGGSYVLNRRWIPSSTDAFLQALRPAASAEMSLLNADVAETVSLAAAVEDHIRVVDVIESPRHIRMSNYRDRILPPYASSLGKAIAAFQSPERLHALLRVYGVYAFTRNTITEPVRIREELAQVREHGYAREHEETVEGGCCFAAPIHVADAPVRAAISVSLPTSRLSEELAHALPKRLVEAAGRISVRLEEAWDEGRIREYPGKLSHAV